MPDTENIVVNKPEMNMVPALMERMFNEGKECRNKATSKLIKWAGGGGGHKGDGACQMGISEGVSEDM